MGTAPTRWKKDGGEKRCKKEEGQSDTGGWRTEEKWNCIFNNLWDDEEKKEGGGRHRFRKANGEIKVDTTLTNGLITVIEVE